MVQVGISLRKVVIVLAILTIAMTVATVYAYALPEQTITEPEQIIVTEHPSKAGTYIIVSEVGYDPLQYYDLDEDPYIRAAIENPDKWVWVGPDSLWKPGMGYAKVDGKYYGIGIIDVLSGPAIESSLPDFILPLGFLGLGVCWVGVGHSYHRKNKKRGILQGYHH